MFSVACTSPRIVALPSPERSPPVSRSLSVPSLFAAILMSLKVMPAPSKPKVPLARLAPPVNTGSPRVPAASRSTVNSPSNSPGLTARCISGLSKPTFGNLPLAAACNGLSGANGPLTLAVAVIFSPCSPLRFTTSVVCASFDRRSTRTSSSTVRNSLISSA